MIEIEKINHDAIWKHYDDHKLEGYIYNNVFPSNLLSSIQNLVVSLLDHNNSKSFMMSGTEIFVNGKGIKLLNHQQNDREIIVLADLTFQPSWYYQTKDTIKKWSDDKLKELLNPQFVKTFSILETLEPFINKDYVFYRWHINYLEPNKCLALHKDTSSLAYHTNNKHTDYSITIYLHDHQEGLGGEFWCPNGFVYPPKSNTALVINGRNVCHGVTTNISDKPRLAFSIRAAHIDNLYLPGNPNEYIWDIQSSL